MDTNKYLFPGDIIFTQSPTLLGKLIRIFTREKGESKTEAGHCGIVTNGGRIRPQINSLPAMIVETLHKVECHVLYTAYVETNTKILIYRPMNLTYDEKFHLTIEAQSYIGKTYGYGKIVLHFFDWLIGNQQFFRRLAVLQKYPICSYLVAKCYGIIGKDFGIKAKFATPDDILDFCQQHPEKYRKIWGWKAI